MLTFSKSTSAVFNISKIQIESNSQPVRHVKKTERGCVQYFKDTNREQFTTARALAGFIRALCSIFQRYKSRAIHNKWNSSCSKKIAVFNISKIQIESNSQPPHIGVLPFIGCVQYFKDTNREQFTTGGINKQIID